MTQTAYHEWYYNNRIWETTTFLGVSCLKSVSDMWNYQEILTELRPQLLVEFGVFNGGPSLYLATVANLVRPGATLLAVDIDLSNVDDRVSRHPAIRFFEASSSDPIVAYEIRRLRFENPGPVFFLIDSDHAKKHVLAELELLRVVTQPGDYVIVEDGNINGHPVLPEHGEGPYEALEEYFAVHPGDYHRDLKRENKFGFTFAPHGFLIRR